MRQSMRPKDPGHMDFQLDRDFVESTAPGFMLRDLNVNERRHLILATDHQLSLLAKTKTWYMDATFHVVKPPSTQLFSIHGFIRSGSSMKQIPLAFCFMSGKRTEDYYEVLRDPSTANCLMTSVWNCALWTSRQPCGRLSARDIRTVGYRVVHSTGHKLCSGKFRSSDYRLPTTREEMCTISFGK
ncbi:uncharacterized protein LOC117316058 [Pecten maximus]|uniref:uncharacterized protein LOC117316058 n=1 Tax=Pecten maximus TaxID=6579 RepID=UPI0014589605|nr:uncharacterized protein LOC117316058 [Pecten maximus]